MTIFSILLSLYSKPMHGYELIKDLEMEMKKKVSTAHIYPFLQLLKKSGYVTVEITGGRKKKVYKLTPKGRKFSRQMFARFGGLIDAAIKPQLSECAHCGCAVYKGSYKEKIRGKIFAFCCKYCARSFR